MALIGSVNPGHGTAACLHYTWNDICVQMTQVYHFTVVASVEASSPLKVLSFISYELQLLWVYYELYLSRTLFYVNWIYNEWCWALIKVNCMKLYYCELTWILNDIWMNVRWFERNLNKTVQYSNANAAWSCLLGCQSTLAQEPSSSRPDGTVTLQIQFACKICLWYF